VNVPFLLPLTCMLSAAVVSLAASTESPAAISRENPVRGETQSLSGSGHKGNDNGPADQASFSFPAGIVFDKTNGDLYVADADNNEIRQIAQDGSVSTLAGSLQANSNDGTGAKAGFNRPFGITWDPDNGNLYVADTNHHAIREVTPQGVVRTIAGSGHEGRADGTGSQATFSHPFGIAYDPADHSLYVADSSNNEIRKVTLDGVVTTFAGGVDGFAEGKTTEARFSGPTGIAYDPDDGNLYVCDWGNGRIRRISPAGDVSTLSGNGRRAVADGDAATAGFLTPAGIVYNPVDGYLYVVEKGTQRLTDYMITVSRPLPPSVRRVSTTTGAVVTIAGNKSRGYVEGSGEVAQFFFPLGIAANTVSGVLYVSDSGNERIREIH